ncbi:MAG: transporter substrate-binding domain-containing protein [Gammaproteobacteria bacterium]|nr:transporter substrate-binding domain-containing protein [Gammaproteobacteria bacterium]
MKFTRKFNTTPATQVRSTFFPQSNNTAFFTWFLVFFTLLTFSGTATAKHALNSAAEPDYPPLSFKNNQGQADGLAVELLHAVTRAMDHETSFEVLPWHEIKQQLANNQRDVLPLVGRTPEREKKFDFTVPYLSLHGVIVVRKDNNHIDNSTDLRGSKVGVMTGDVADEYMRRENLTSSLVTTKNYTEALLLLRDGQLDAVVIQQLVAQQLIKQLGLENIEIRTRIPGFRQDFCFAVTEGDKNLLAMLNEGLSRVVSNGTYAQLQKKWLGAFELDKLESSPRQHYLTDAEKQWIQLHPEVAFIGDQNWLPYEAFDADSSYIGIIADHLKLIEKITGLKFNPVPVPGREAPHKMIEEGKASVITSNSADTFLKKQFTPVEPFIHNPVVIIMNSQHNYVENLDEIRNKKIVIIKDYAYTADIYSQYPDFEFFEVENIEQGLEAVSQGRSDALLATMALASYNIADMGLNNIKVVGKTSVIMNLTLFVANDQPVLHSIINKTLKSISSNESQNIMQHWIKNRYVEKTDYTITILVGVGLLLILLLILLWNHRLRKEIEIRHKAEEALKKSESRYRSLINSAGNTIAVIDLEGRFTQFNHAAEQLTGYKSEEIIGKTVWETVIPEEQQAGVKNVFENLRNGKIDIADEYENEWLTRDGSRRLLHWHNSVLYDETGKVSHIVAMGYDITESRSAQVEHMRMQNELQQAQKMESLGLLTGGIAHDFNNLLGIINGFAKLTLDRYFTHDEDKPAEYVRHIQQAGIRAAKLVEQMLDFSRIGFTQDITIELAPIIKEDIKMLRSTLPSTIEIKTKIELDLPPVLINPSQLHQILMNLVINARDAMNGIGQLTIQLGWAHNLNTKSPISHKPVKGDWIELCISDTGSGIDTDIINNIFDPFFTTKEVGEGTGMGLSVIYRIVENHGGHILLDTAINEGTTICILFAPALEAGNQLSDSIQEPAKMSRGNGSEILVVDDEAILAEYISTLLETHNYQPCSMTDSGKALALFKQNPDRFSMLITDQTMPKMMGTELIAAIREIRPELPVIICSGYSDKINVNTAIGLNIPYFNKPIDSNKLLLKIAELLNI